MEVRSRPPRHPLDPPTGPDDPRGTGPTDLPRELRRDYHELHMAKYEVKETAEGLDIRVAELAGQQEALLEAFTECQEGRCTCPTDEYEKVEQMDVGATADEVSVRLTAKPGEHFDRDEIEACLDYTTSRHETTG